jgi:DNA-binding transcriptional regulator GbsR (MarR family)
MKRMASSAIKNKTDNLAEKVEEMGIILEQTGYAPIPSRLLTYLLISEPPYRDFYEIQEFLKASKSSISTTLNLLLQKEVISYMTFNGNRKRYFQINTKGLLKNLKQQYKQGQLVNDMVRETLQHRRNSKFQQFNQELKEVVDFNNYILEGIEKLVKDWEAGHK